MDGQRQVLGIEDAFRSESAKIEQVKLQLPDDTTTTADVFSPLEHDLIVATMVTNADRGVLLAWQHQFAADRWSWVLPTAGAKVRQSPKSVASDACTQMTGWTPSKLKPLLTFDPLSFVGNSSVQAFWSTEATMTNSGRDSNEAADLCWTTASELKVLIDTGDVTHGITLAVLCYALSKGLIS